MATQTPPQPSPPPAAQPQQAARESVQCIPSEQLLAGAQEVQIDHHGTLYRLRQTSLGKLILTK
jgi:hemin uptake protein HemP